MTLLDYFLEVVEKTVWFFVVIFCCNFIFHWVSVASVRVTEEECYLLLEYLNSIQVMLLTLQGKLRTLQSLVIRLLSEKQQNQLADVTGVNSSLSVQSVASRNVDDTEPAKEQCDFEPSHLVSATQQGIMFYSAEGCS